MSFEVTAVITTCGRPVWAYEALESLSLETHPDVQIVVVDDGGEFVAPADGGRRPVEVIRANGAGVARARNIGLAAAQGAFIIYLDDDDLAMPHRIAHLVSVAREHRADLCFGMTRRVIDGEPHVLASVPTHLTFAGLVGFCDLLTCAPHINAVLARTNSLRAVGGFDAGADHFDDWSAWLRMADRGAIIWSTLDTVASWRIHDNGLSGRLLGSGAMKARLIALFERLQPSLSTENAHAVAAARAIVMSANIATYDDYADAMARARQSLHVEGRCFDPSVSSHRVGRRATPIIV